MIFFSNKDDVCQRGGKTSEWLQGVVGTDGNALALRVSVHPHLAFMVGLQHSLPNPPQVERGPHLRHRDSSRAALLSPGQVSQEVCIPSSSPAHDRNYANW